MKDIKFIAPKVYIDDFDDRPVPSLNHLPDWYKKLKHHPNRTTIKGCKPFLDSMTAGYVLKLPQEYYIEITTVEKDKYKIHVRSCYGDFAGFPKYQFLNLNEDMETSIHPTYQIEGSPQLEKNFNFPVMKFYNPWKIKTPDGYSCLFTPPLNRVDERFEIINGIVDTDSFTECINFPFILKKDYLFKNIKDGKYFSILKKGTPYCQIFPFKREGWKMKIQESDSKIPGSMFTEKFNWYRNKIWHRKSYK
mgnify:CR=1 FL=1|tara:strand:+ start:1683 stop:2429 length:747 start_codon:yes stop_codon:yes gene_type:complete